ncbi:MAG: hypothetical protein Q9217_003433 [Psora testacea]
MAWPGRFFADDEELGKKNDDHRPSNGAVPPAAWSVRKPAPAIRKRRIIYAICAVLFVYLFVKNIPSDLGPRPRWADTRVYQGPRAGNLATPSKGPPTRKPPRPPTLSEADEHYHDGPIKFYKLASSLHSAAKLGGQKEVNKNVLFAAANLKSLSELVPLACEMARRERSDVHFAIMGRDDIEIQEIQKLNGASKEDCNVSWHDARPDYSRWSSDYRMEVSVAASLGYIQEFIHPQVILVHDPSKEEDFFVTAIRGKAMDLSKPVIELPPAATENLMWITRLDSASLAAWPKTYIDVIVQAPSQSSGSLIRLLKSVENADYFGARRPHLTIELPADVDPPTWRYLENLIWPPIDWSGSPHVSQVSLKHRLPRRTSTPEEASARLVEAFYPVRTTTSHVLLLSPQAELSPLYYHYLFYTLLEYKYSDRAKESKDAANLMGISLDLPTTFLNDTTEFHPPLKEKSKLEGIDAPNVEQTPFLWQLPNNNAALYVGEKWMEFHSFMMGRLSKPPTTSPKIVSEKHPSWLEYMLELMRARGWSLLYPGLFANDITLITIHDELYQIPEEFSKKTAPTSTPKPASSSDQPLEVDPSTQARKPPPNTEHPLLESSLASFLPSQGNLPELDRMPLISYDGTPMSIKDSRIAANSFAKDFRQTIGSCGPSEPPSTYQWAKAVDLFCHLDDVYDHHAAAGPMSMEHNDPSSQPKPQHTEPNDPDMISPANAITAKQEAAHHLNRQAGAQESAKDEANPADPKADVKGAQKVKDEPPTSGDMNSPHTNAAESDRNVGVREEFRAHLERQNTPALGNKKTGSALNKEKELKQTQESAKEDSMPKDEVQKGESQTKPTHGAFDKEQPKPPNEKEIGGIAGKSPGW